MSATNGIGFEVQAYDNHLGWRRASRVFKTMDEAKAAMEKWPVAGVGLRVYESLEVA